MLRTWLHLSISGQFFQLKNFLFCYVSDYNFWSIWPRSLLLTQFILLPSYHLLCYCFCLSAIHCVKICPSHYWFGFFNLLFPSMKNNVHCRKIIIPPLFLFFWYFFRCFPRKWVLRNTLFHNKLFKKMWITFYDVFLGS